MLVKRNSNPGADVLADFSKSFPHYSLEWLLTGEGTMLKKEYPSEKETHSLANSMEETISLQVLHADIKRDLKTLSEGITHNFEVVSRGIQVGLMKQGKILDFVEKLNADEILKATSKLNETLNKENSNQ